MGYDVLFNEALRLHENGRLDEAEAIYRRILNTAPKNADVLNLLGLIAQAKNVHNQAVDLFYQAITNAPTHLPLYFNLGISLLVLGKYYEAIDVFEKVNIKESFLKIAGIYVLLGNKAKAEEYYRKAIDKDENYLEALAGIAYLKDDVSSLEKLDCVDAFYYLAKIYFKRNDFSKALEFAMRAFEYDSENDEINVLLGDICLKLGKNDDASVYFRRCNPNNVSALINLANFETGLKAESLYKRAVELEPNNWLAHFNYGRWLYLQKRLPEALEEYRKAVVVAPNEPEISNNLGVVLKDIKEYEEALGLFMNAFSKSPLREEFSINIVETILLFSQENEEKALKIAKNWQKNAKNNVFSNNLIKILEEKGEIDKEYFEVLFDNFAANYEEVLAKIEYNLPKVIKNRFGEVEGTVVDLGCGSGLLGKELKNAKNKVIGVDLSQKMLNLAEKTHKYDELLKMDVLEFLKSRKLRDTLIVAADVFCYLGDLRDIIKECSGNSLCFSVELYDGEENFILSRTGRYKHKKDYVLELLGDRKATIGELVLRKEDGEDVRGILVISSSSLQG